MPTEEVFGVKQGTRVKGKRFKRMSFAMTKKALLSGQKDVTRRREETWKSLRAGDTVLAVDKVMGMKKGEKAVVWGTCLILDVRVEVLNTATDDEARREGFPGETGKEFVDMFCKKMNCAPTDRVRRIEFEFTPAQTTRETVSHGCV